MKEAAEYLKASELIGIPTETVYGLAANALDPNAVKKIFEVKGRPQDNPLIVHICDLDMIFPLVQAVSETALRLAEAFWPGPLTIVLPKSDVILNEISAGLDTVAVRFPSHKIALALIKEAGFPLAAPSANLSGRPSPTTAQHVLQDLNGKIPLILDGGKCEVGLESTVISLKDDTVKLLRPGAITPSMLKKYCGKLEVSGAVLKRLKKGETAPSPGMKYKHYAPKANVVIIKGDLPDFIDYVNSKKSQDTFALVFDDEQAGLAVQAITYGVKPKEQAQELFSALRRVDELGAKTVYVRCPDINGIGLAVYNRLLRAAGFQEIDLSL